MASDLRRKLIREVLDSDKNINKRASQIQIKKYSTRRRDVTQKSIKLRRDTKKINVYASSIRKYWNIKRTHQKCYCHIR